MRSLRRAGAAGTVTDGGAHEFTLHTGARALRVDVAATSYDPLDDKGYPKVDVGDRASVMVKMNSEPSQRRELEARAILVIVDG